MKAPTLKQAKQAALDIHTLIVKANAAGCAAAGVLPGECGTGRQCAHIIPRDHNSWVATDPDNGWVLCNKHHIMVDNNPVRWLRLVQTTIGTYSVVVMQEANDHIRENLGCTPLMWWRNELLELVGLAGTLGVDLKTIPTHIKRWAESQTMKDE